MIGDEVAVEVKASKRVTPRHERGLRALKDEGIVQRLYLVSQDEVQKRSGNIECLHWRTFLHQIWGGGFWD